MRSSPAGFTLRAAVALALARRSLAGLALALAGGAFLHCEAPREAPRVARPLVVDGSQLIEFETDVGFVVQLTDARLAVLDVQLTTQGELHTASVTQRLGDFLVKPAHAHPGHYEGGEVIGEAPGRFLVDWLTGDGAELGRATLIASTYTAANFTFVRARGGDDLDEGDPWTGHTALLAGVARKDDREVAFTFALDAPDGRLLVGAPFEATVSEEVGGEVLFRLLPRDELSQTTLLDGIDFSALDADGDGDIRIEPTSTADAAVDAYNQVRRRLLTHNHYGFVYREQANGPGGAP